MRSFSWN